MDAQLLTLLVDIIDSGNLSEAARRLKMSRANISYHLNRLERTVGVQLMRRTTRNIEPTEAGLELYRHGLAIRDELRAAGESIAMLGHGLRGTIRLSMPTGFGLQVMSGWLLEFKKRYPDIYLDVLFDNRVDDLLREEIDIAIRVMPSPPDQMVAVELMPVRYLLCTSIDYAVDIADSVTIGDLPRLPLITSTASGKNLQVSAYRNDECQKVAVHPTMTSENFQFLRDAVIEGLGFGLLPEYVIAGDIAEGKVRIWLDDWRFSVFGTTMFLLRMPNRYQTVAVRTLIDFIKHKSAHFLRSEITTG